MVSLANSSSETSPTAAGAAAAATLRDTWIPLALVVVTHVIVVVRTAWICDDACITFRTVDNFLLGHGFTWNPGERVQTYTHPLWMFLLLSVIRVTKEAYFTTLALGICCSVIAVLLLCCCARSKASATMAVLALTLSHCFVDYSTSGLENPLTHLFLGAYLLVWFKVEHGVPKVFFLSLLASLLALNRLDVLLLCAPSLMVALVAAKRWRGLGAVALGFVPLVGWELFSIIYYGFPLPNTYYAKLHTGIPSHALLEQGIYYLLNSLEFDPQTAVLLGCAALVPLVTGRGRGWALMAGAILYVLYVVWIGGDFMSGRFLAAPLFMAAGVLAYSIGSVSAALAIVIVAAAVSFFIAEPGRGAADHRGIWDERRHFSSKTALSQMRRNESKPIRRWADIYAIELQEQKRRVVVNGAVGQLGWKAGRRVHLIDSLGLGDPLLSRLPARVFDRELKDFMDDTLGLQSWRVGHYSRAIPRGYVASIEQGKNLIEDERLARYYDKLRLIIRGRLLSGERLRTIWRMNLGAYDHLIDFEKYRFFEVKKITLAALGGPKPKGLRWNAPENAVLDGNGLMIELGSPTHADQIEISVDSDDDYLISYVRGRRDLAARTIPRRTRDKGRGLDLRLVDVPRRAVLEGYDRILVIPLEGHAGYSVGHLRLLSREPR